MSNMSKSPGGNAGGRGGPPARQRPTEVPELIIEAAKLAEVTPDDVIDAIMTTLDLCEGKAPDERAALYAKWLDPVSTGIATRYDLSIATVQQALVACVQAIRDTPI